MSWRVVQEERLRTLGYSEEDVQKILVDFEEPVEVSEIPTNRYEPGEGQMRMFS